MKHSLFLKDGEIFMELRKGNDSRSAFFDKILNVLTTVSYTHLDVYKRQCELNAQLDLENAKAVDADLSGPEEERKDVYKRQVEEEANQLYDQLEMQYLAKHKPQNPTSTMEMWKIREQAKMQAEEVVLNQICLLYTSRCV